MGRILHENKISKSRDVTAVKVKDKKSSWGGFDMTTDNVTKQDVYIERIRHDNRRSGKRSPDGDDHM